MAENTPIINILTYKLPYDLANQIYNEYQERLREANFIIANSRRYKRLEGDGKTIETLLALSIFHKRVISNLDAAIKFHGRVTRNSNATHIKIGKYDFTWEERNMLQAIVISYNNLIARYKVPSSLMDYYLTKDFLWKLVILKSILE